METYSMVDAARIAGVSDKTLRRAIGHELKIQPRLSPKYPIRIAKEDLDAYIVSRVSTHAQVKASHIQQSNDTQERFTAMQAQIDDLIRRVQELEQTVHSLSLAPVSPVQDDHLNKDTKTTENAPLGPVQEVSKQAKKRTKKQTERQFTMADFSKALQNEYVFEVIEGDIKATWVLGIYLSNSVPAYSYGIRKVGWHSLKQKKVISREMLEHGQALETALNDVAIAEMVKHGWVEIAAKTDMGRTLYRKPD